MTRAPDRVGDLMQRDVVAFEPEARVEAVIREMVARDIGSVVVVRGGRPVGVFTERDLLRHIVDDPAYLQRSVGEIMSSPAITTSPEAETVEVFEVMTEKRIRRLPVVEDGLLVGIITERDLMRWVTQVAHEYEEEAAPEGRPRPSDR